MPLKLFLIETDRDDVMEQVTAESMTVWLESRRRAGTFKVTELNPDFEMAEKL